MGELRLTIQISRRASSSIRKETVRYQLVSGMSIGERWMNSVTRTFNSLRTLANRGTPFHSEHEELRQLRWIRVEGFPKHLVFYRVKQEQGTAEIIDVVHAARDLEEVLGISLRN